MASPMFRTCKSIQIRPLVSLLTNKSLSPEADRPKMLCI